ncbi:hypothetical protein LDENG_00261420 [Lucifuga dentata]|nr:hypothetical protein LDENG_00261420 [Lucifuga dentata]
MPADQSSDCRIIPFTLNLNLRLFSQHPTVNDELPNRILSGTVQVKPNICRFQGSSVESDDGNVVEDIDLVVFPTGYTFSFPFLTSHVLSVSGNKASLFWCSHLEPLCPSLRCRPDGPNVYLKAATSFLQWLTC